MIKGATALTLIIFLLSSISAQCTENQIDINTASLGELDNLTGIGPAKAQAIIDTRPFVSVDDLMRVSGIGNATLSKIKTQGLACVVNEETQNTETNDNQSDTEIDVHVEANLTVQKKQAEKNSSESSGSVSKTSITSNTVDNSQPSQTETTTEITPIKLNSKDIKTEDNKEVLKKNFALYGIILFCVLFGALFLFKQIRRKKENEFR